MLENTSKASRASPNPAPVSESAAGRGESLLLPPQRRPAAGGLGLVACRHLLIERASERERGCCWERWRIPFPHTRTGRTLPPPHSAPFDEQSDHDDGPPREGSSLERPLSGWDAGAESASSGKVRGVLLSASD